jgi:hypothetical protein
MRGLETTWSPPPLEVRPMRFPRLRVRLWLLMVLVAVLACLFAAARRPHPVTGFVEEDFNAMVGWSDGTFTRKPGPIPIQGDHLGPFIRVRWSDGSTSYYFCLRRGPYR